MQAAPAELRAPPCWAAGACPHGGRQPRPPGAAARGGPPPALVLLGNKLGEHNVALGLTDACQPPLCVTALATHPAQRRACLQDADVACVEAGVFRDHNRARHHSQAVALRVAVLNKHLQLQDTNGHRQCIPQVLLGSQAQAGYQRLASSASSAGFWHSSSTPIRLQPWGSSMRALQLSPCSVRTSSGFTAQFGWTV